MNIWLSKIALREWTGPKVRFWFAIKLSRNQFHLLWIIQSLMEWEMAKGAWVMRWSEGCVCACVCWGWMGDVVVVGGGLCHSKWKQGPATWCSVTGELLSLHLYRWCGSQWCSCVSNLLIAVSPVEISIDNLLGQNVNTLLIDCLFF